MNKRQIRRIKRVMYLIPVLYVLAFLLVEINDFFLFILVLILHGFVFAMIMYDLIMALLRGDEN